MRYRVIVTRDTTESALVDVEADNEHDANHAALNLALDWQVENWEGDECSEPGRAYITGPAEEIIDNE